MWLDLHVQVVYPVILVLWENMQNQEGRKRIQKYIPKEYVRALTCLA